MTIRKVLKPLLSVLSLVVFGTAASPSASAQLVQADGIPPQVVNFSGGQPNTAKSFCLEHEVHGAASSDHRFGAGVGNVRVTFVGRPIPEDMTVAAALATPAQGGTPVMSMQGVTTDGAGDPSGVVITPRSDVASIEFLTPTAVFANDVRLSADQQKVVSERVAEALRGVDLKNKSYEENRDNVWQKPLGLLEEPLTDGLRVVRTVTQDFGKYLSIRLGRLAQQADCSLVKTPNNSYLLHDLGASEAELRKIVGEIPVVNGVRRIKVVITHADLDHYRGLTWLLNQAAKPDADSPRLVIDEVLIGTPASKLDKAQSDADYSGRFKDVVSLLKNSFKLSEAPGGFSRFVREGNTSPMDLATAYEAPDPGEPNIIQLPIDPDCSIRIMSPGDPDLIGTPRHAHNLIVSYEHRGFTFLDAGDADPRQLFEFVSSEAKEAWADVESDARELGEDLHSYDERIQSFDAEIAELQQKKNKTDRESIALEFLQKLRAEVPSKDQLKKDFDAAQAKATAAQKDIYDSDEWHPAIDDLHVDVLKWPHHAWRPTSNRQVAIMKAFLKAYRPREILVCVPRNMTEAISQRIKDIEAIIDAAKAEETKAGRPLNISLRVTNEDGCDTLEFRAEAEQLKAALERAGLWCDGDAV